MMLQTITLSLLSLFGSHDAASDTGRQVEVSRPSAQTITRWESVSFDELDLTREAGAKVLLSRIHHAAERVCGRDSLVNLGAHAAYRECVSQSVATAIVKLNVPMVTATYQAANPNAAPLASAPLPQGTTGATSEQPTSAGDHP